jgi:hypothetical protein
MVATKYMTVPIAERALGKKYMIGVLTSKGREIVNPEKTEKNNPCTAKTM